MVVDGRPAGCESGLGRSEWPGSPVKYASLQSNVYIRVAHGIPRYLRAYLQSICMQEVRMLRGRRRRRRRGIIFTIIIKCMFLPLACRLHAAALSSRWFIRTISFIEKLWCLFPFLLPVLLFFLPLAVDSSLPGKLSTPLANGESGL